VVEGENNHTPDRDYYQFLTLLYNAIDSAACDLPAHAPLDAEAVKAYMEAVIRETPISQDVLITDLEQYAGCISHATAAYNSTAPAAPPPAPASPPPAPVAETAEELRRRARNLTKKLAQTAGLQSRVDAGHDPCAQEVEKLALRSERENELAAVTEALAALPPLASSDESGSDDEATVPDRAAPSLHERLVAAAADRHLRERDRYDQVREAEAARRERDRSDQAREAEAFLLREAARREPPRREPPRYEAEEVREWREEAVRRERTRAAAAQAQESERFQPEIDVDREEAAHRRIVDDDEASLALARRLMAEESSRAATVPRRDHPATESASAQSVAAQRWGRDRAERDLAATGLWPAATEPSPRVPGPAWGPPPAPAVAAPPPAPPPAPAATQAARPDPPDALVCPISMELMRDPVLAMDSHTYDRSSIEAWLKTGKKTSPKTNEPLPSTTLLPNHAVKSMVQDYLETCKKHHC
jgi:hypothetical protein